MKNELLIGEWPAEKALKHWQSDLANYGHGPDEWTPTAEAMKVVIDLALKGLRSSTPEAGLIPARKVREIFTHRLNLSYDQRAYSWHEIQDALTSVDQHALQPHPYAPLPEEGVAQWNAAMDRAAKLLRANADGCSPGSEAEKQNWPFVLETMARELDKLKHPPGPQEREPTAYVCPYCGVVPEHRYDCPYKSPAA